MRRFFKSKPAVFALIIAVVAAGVMIYAFVSPSPTPLTKVLGIIVTPIERGASAVGDKISGFFGYFKGIDALRAENEELKAQIAEYRKLESEYYAAINENSDLRVLSELKTRHTDYDVIMCSVITKVSRSYTSSFTINRGSADGIEAGDCVMTDGGFVGIVRSVNVTSAEVMTLINVESKIAARSARTKEIMVAEGNFELAPSGLLKIAYLKNDADVAVGDVIETSSMGEKYPSGITVGTVTAVEREKHGISSYAVIEPAVDVTSLKTVFVVKSFESVD